MADNIVISTDALRIAGKQAGVPAETLNAAVAKFEAALAALGKPWGEDEIGSQWAKEYEPGLKLFLDTLRSVSGGLTKLSGDIISMADIYDLAEHGNSR